MRSLLFSSDMVVWFPVHEGGEDLAVLQDVLCSHAGRHWQVIIRAMARRHHLIVTDAEIKVCRFVLLCLPQECAPFFSRTSVRRSRSPTFHQRHGRRSVFCALSENGFVVCCQSAAQPLLPSCRPANH